MSQSWFSSDVSEIGKLSPARMLLREGISLHEHEFPPRVSPSPDHPWIRSSFSRSAVPPVSYGTSSSSGIPNPRRHSGEPKPRDQISASDSEPLVTMSSNRHSLANSDVAEDVIGSPRRRKRSSARSVSTFALAQPAPLTIQQKLLHIRPKLLFQLQLLSPEKRPTPTIDVLASTVIVPRLADRFPRLFKGKGNLGSKDVMVLKSENYSVNINDESAENIEDESIAHREIIAVICRVRGAPNSTDASTRTEICFSDGSIWYAAALRRGVFEFTQEDPATGQRQIARWVPRSKVRPQSDLPTSPSDLYVPDTSKYSFSMLNPATRRHPVLASLQQNALEIPDKYTSFSAVDGGIWHGQGEHVAGMARSVNGEIRALIQVTGVWVALQLGWCPNFRYDDAHLSYSSSRRRQTTGGLGRSISLIQDSDKRIPRMGSPMSISDSGQVFGSRQERLLRSSTQNPHDSPSSIYASVTGNRPRRRAVSVGADFMQKAAARKVHPSYGNLQALSDHEVSQLAHNSENAVPDGLGQCPISSVGQPAWVTLTGPPPSQQPLQTTADIRSSARVEASKRGVESGGKSRKDGYDLVVNGIQTQGRQRAKKVGKQEKTWWKALVSCFTHETRVTKPI